MAHYTTQYETPKFAAPTPPAHLSVQVNGGQLIVEAQVGSGWVTIDTITTDSARSMDVASGKFRFTPSGGAIYDFNVNVE